MKKLIINTTLMLFANIAIYFWILYVDTPTLAMYGRYGILENYQYGFFYFLVWGVGLYHIKERFSLWITLLLFTLLIGLLEFNLFIDYMDSCPTCHLVEECIHDCDGPCCGWYTFENEKEWLFFTYSMTWLIFFLALLFIKLISSKISLYALLFTLGIFVVSVVGFTYLDLFQSLISESRRSHIHVTLQDVYLLVPYSGVLSVVPLSLIIYLYSKIKKSKWWLVFIVFVYVLLWLGIVFPVFFGELNQWSTWLDYEVFFHILGQGHFYFFFVALLLTLGLLQWRIKLKGK